MSRLSTTLVFTFIAVTCFSVAGAVTCDSFKAPEACNGVVTDSGACFWNATTSLCDAGDKAEGMVAITSLEGDATTDIQNGTFCTQEPETGNCRGMFPSWYYAADKNSCDQFIYGGCGGNANRFETGEACAAAAEQFCPNETKGNQVTIESSAAALFTYTNVFFMLSLYYYLFQHHSSSSSSS